MRRAYVQCILKQDIGWFDENPAGQIPTAVTANMAKVQDGLGRKIGDIVLNGLSGERLMDLLIVTRVLVSDDEDAWWWYLLVECVLCP